MRPLDPFWFGIWADEKRDEKRSNGMERKREREGERERERISIETTRVPFYRMVPASIKTHWNKKRIKRTAQFVRGRLYECREAFIFQILQQHRVTFRKYKFRSLAQSTRFPLRQKSRACSSNVKIYRKIIKSCKYLFKYTSYEQNKKRIRTLFFAFAIFRSLFNYAQIQSHIWKWIFN